MQRIYTRSFVAKNSRRKNNTNPLFEFVFFQDGEQNDAAFELKCNFNEKLRYLL